MERTTSMVSTHLWKLTAAEIYIFFYLTCYITPFSKLYDNQQLKETESDICINLEWNQYHLQYITKSKHMKNNNMLSDRDSYIRRMHANNGILRQRKKKGKSSYAKATKQNSDSDKEYSLHPNPPLHSTDSVLTASLSPKLNTSTEHSCMHSCTWSVLKQPHSSHLLGIWVRLINFT